MRVPDFISGAVLFLFAAVALGMAIAFPSAPMGQQVGPGSFPIVISSVLMIASALLILGSVRRRMAGQRRAAYTTAPSTAPDLRSWLVIAAIAALPVFYILTVETLGFLICGFLVAAISMLVLWSGVLRICAISLVTVAVIDLVFRGFFGIPLDRGLIYIPWW